MLATSAAVVAAATAAAAAAAAATPPPPSKFAAAAITVDSVAMVLVRAWIWTIIVWSWASLALDSLLMLAAHLAVFLLEATDELAISWMYYRISLLMSAIWLALL
jgi:hypothetical protein